VNLCLPGKIFLLVLRQLSIAGLVSLTVDKLKLNNKTVISPLQNVLLITEQLPKSEKLQELFIIQKVILLFL